MQVPRFRRWQDAVYAGLFGAWAAAFLWTERRHDLTFPVPWPDEGSFLWPALAFRDHLTLYAPEINPAREIFWMPPGFMILEGIVFKFWSFSLSSARLHSAIYLVLAMACLAIQVRGSRARFGHALLIGVFSFAPIFQLVGNTARMESLVLLVATGGFLLLDRGKAAGLGVLAFGPLVHPNGVFPLAGGVAYFLFAFRGRMKMSRGSLGVLTGAGICWLIYVLHVGAHWHEFVQDMSSQLKWKQSEAILNGPLLGRLFNPFRVVIIAVLVLVLVPALRSGARVGALVALGLSLLVGSGLTVGWLYEVYAAFGALLAAMAVLELAAVLAERFLPKGARLAIGAAALSLSAGAVAMSRHRFLMTSVSRATMPAAPAPEYCTAEERARVESFIRSSIRKDRPIFVQFLPDSDSLLFHHLRSPSVRILTQTYYSTRPNLYILHDSPWFPHFLRDIELADFALRNDVDRRLPDWDIVAYNVRGGRWIAVRRDGPGLPWH